MLRKAFKHTQYNADDDLDGLGDPAMEAEVKEGATGIPAKLEGGGAGVKGSPLNPDLAPPVEGADDDTTVVVPLVAKPLANDELTKALAKLAEGQTALTTAITPKKVPPTAEELKKQWKVWEANPEYVKKFFKLADDASPEQITEGMSQLHALRDGFMQQTGTFVQAALQQALGPMASQIQEFQSFRDEQQRQQLWTDFNGRYPALADPKFRDILRITSDGLASATHKTNEEFFDALAKGAAGYITQINPAFVLGDPQNATPNAGKMPKLPRGGAGGGGGTAKGSTPKQTDKDDIDSLG